MGQYDDELINHFERYFVTYKNIWSFKSQVESYENKFLNMYLVDVDVV